MDEAPRPKGDCIAGSGQSSQRKSRPVIYDAMVIDALIKVWMSSEALRQTAGTVHE
jgi:hypothetical protein